MRSDANPDTRRTYCHTWIAYANSNGYPDGNAWRVSDGDHAIDEPDNHDW